MVSGQETFSYTCYLCWLTGTFNNKTWLVDRRRSRIPVICSSFSVSVWSNILTNFLKMSGLQWKRNNDSAINNSQPEMTLSDAMIMHSVTPEAKVKSEEIDLTKSDENSDQGLLDFSFGSYKEMEKFEVVVNASGDSVSVRSPKICNFPQPRMGFAEHHIFFRCETPEKSFRDKTVVPMKEMYGHYFYEKKFIKTEHEVINGKINAWRLESMKAFARLRQSGKVLQDAIECQESYVRDRVGIIQQNLDAFDYCHVSVLNKDSIKKFLMLEDEMDHSVEVVYNFCKYDCIHLYIRPGDRNCIDVVTRFDRNPKLDFVFGKHDSDRVKGRAYAKRLKIGVL